MVPEWAGSACELSKKLINEAVWLTIDFSLLKSMFGDTV